MKHTFLQALLLVICFNSSNIFSLHKFKCSEQKIDLLKSQGSKYTFIAKTKCSFKNHDLNYKKILGSYLEGLRSDDKIKIIDLEKKEYDIGTHYILKVEQRIDPGHGKMLINADISLSSNNNEFAFSFDSSKIKAKGNSAFTKDIIEKSSLSKKDKKYQFILSKQTIIEKPWYAPEFVFIKEVKDGLSQDLESMITYHRSFLPKS